jgi:2-oxoglutarate ferredoxin oxidoreductase subunit beta
MKEAVEHDGFAIVEVMSPCVTYNKINTYAWFKQNVYYLDDGYDATDRVRAFEALTAEGKIPLGVIYREQRPTLETLTHLGATPIVDLRLDPQLRELVAIQDAYA